MLLSLLDNVSSFKPVQPWNAPLSMLSKLSVNVSLVKPLHSLKAYPPMLFTLFGNVNSFKPLQRWKAASAMLSKLSGNVNSFKPLHSLYLLLVDYQYFTP